jgi:hypothetical protein
VWKKSEPLPQEGETLASVPKAPEIFYMHLQAGKFLVSALDPFLIGGKGQSPWWVGLPLGPPIAQDFKKKRPDTDHKAFRTYLAFLRLLIFLRPLTSNVALLK